jgi:hypothetical protein
MKKIIVAEFLGNCYNFKLLRVKHASIYVKKHRYSSQKGTVLVPYFSRYLKKLFGAGAGAGAGDANRIAALRSRNKCFRLYNTGFKCLMVTNTFYVFILNFLQVRTPQYRRVQSYVNTTKKTMITRAFDSKGL